MTNQPAQPNLTPEQALQALAQAARKAQLSYNDHAVCDMAVQVLAQIAIPQQEPTPEQTPDPEQKKTTKRGRRSSNKVETEEVDI